MFNAKVMRTIFKENHFQNANIVSLKTGQMYMGKILKLYPQNMALVQLGSMKLFAKVEAALTLGHYYWFQVVHHDDHIHLKITESTYAKNDLTAVAKELLKEASLPLTKENVQILLRFLQKDVPIPRNMLVEGLRLVQEGTDLLQTVNALQMMMKKNLPFTETVFRSLIAVQNSVPLHEELTRLSELLTIEPDTNNLLKLKQQINQILQQIPSKILIDPFIQRIQSQNVSTVASFLEKLGITPSKLNLKDADEFVHFLQSLRNNHQALLTFWKQLSSSIMDPNVHVLFSEDERQLFNELYKVVVQHKGTLEWDSSDYVSKTLKQFISLLGLQFEYEMASRSKNSIPYQEFNGLKSLLLKALSDVVNPQTKDLADSLIHRLTGQQLLSYENGPIQQFVLQVPLTLGNQLTDFIVQWNGKKRKSGGIDPDYCRIVFYLNLEAIKETIVDVHIQNRIIQISIINESEYTEPLVTRLHPELKENLAKLDYQLSSIKVTNTAKSNNKEKMKKDSPLTLSMATSLYTGVDIRI
jgi:hypothetical protein